MWELTATPDGKSLYIWNIETRQIVMHSIPPVLKAAALLLVNNQNKLVREMEDFERVNAGAGRLVQTKN